MQIVADENIPFAEEVFGRLGEVRLMSGREMSRDALGDAEVLFVRSVTKVGRELLEGTSVRFVATATIGADHVDEDYLAACGIGFSSAPGCNARSVAEYVTAALLVTADRGGFRLAGKTIGIIGVGNVGSRVEEKARILGMTPILNDPPLERRTGDGRFRPLEELLDADIITLHVPLTKTGRDTTLHLCDAAMLDRLRPGCIVVNTSRGAVVDGGALKARLDAGRLHAVLDVWEGEPSIDADLLKLVGIGTPHIAGYSLDGKANGTMMVYRAACGFLGIEAEDVQLDLPAPEPAELTIAASGRDDEDVIREAVLGGYDILRDDAMLRKITELDAAGRGPYFDHLRKTYPVRREFPSRTVNVRGGSPELAERIAALGFRPGQRL